MDRLDAMRAFVRVVETGSLAHGEGNRRLGDRGKLKSLGNKIDRGARSELGMFAPVLKDKEVCEALVRMDMNARVAVLLDDVPAGPLRDFHDHCGEHGLAP